MWNCYFYIFTNHACFIHLDLYFVIASIFKWWCVKKNAKAGLIDGATSKFNEFLGGLSPKFLEMR